MSNFASESHFSLADLLAPEPPRPPKVWVEFGAVSHVGNVRSCNEDHYLISRLCKSLQVLRTNLPQGDSWRVADEEGYLMAVADGMGGQAGGDRVSALVVERVERFVLETLKWFSRLEDDTGVMDELRTALERIDRTVIAAARADRTLAGVGTTLTTATSFGADLFIVHVGDSRAYLYREGQLRQLTRDHTLVQRMIETGLIRPEQAKSHRMRNLLTNVIGGSDTGFEGDTYKHRLADGDRLLLCTDGLSDPVSEDIIAGILDRYPQPPDACQALVDAALDRGGPDNVTVLLAAYSIPES
jgi:PPM family protein phosphatase